MRKCKQQRGIRKEGRTIRRRRAINGLQEERSEEEAGEAKTRREIGEEGRTRRRRRAINGLQENRSE